MREEPAVGEKGSESESKRGERIAERGELTRSPWCQDGEGGGFWSKRTQEGGHLATESPTGDQREVCGW